MMMGEAQVRMSEVVDWADRGVVRVRAGGSFGEVGEMEKRKWRGDGDIVEQ